MIENTKIIFSHKMAGYLQFKGNPLIAIKKDYKQLDKNIFIFAITDKLNNDISNYKDFLNKYNPYNN
jgi:hypothetical protein